MQRASPKKVFFLKENQGRCLAKHRILLKTTYRASGNVANESFPLPSPTLWAGEKYFSQQTQGIMNESSRKRTCRSHTPHEALFYDTNFRTLYKWSSISFNELWVFHCRPVMDVFWYQSRKLFNGQYFFHTKKSRKKIVVEIIYHRRNVFLQ